MEIVVKLILTGLVICVPIIITYDWVPDKFRVAYTVFLGAVAFVSVLVLCGAAIFAIWQMEM